MASYTYSELKEKAGQFVPANLIAVLGFDRSIDIACDMLHNGEWDQELHQYSVELLEDLRKKYPEKWDSTWRYDALLGYACDIVLAYDERYAAFKRAYDKADPPPPELLVGLAYCFCAPGPRKITEEEAIVLVAQTL